MHSARRALAERIATELGDLSRGADHGDMVALIENAIDDEAKARLSKERPFGMIVDSIATLFPKHNCELSLVHNEHRNKHQTVEQWIEDFETVSAAEVPWSNDDSRARCIAQDSVWVLQWYTDTTVGFWMTVGATLEEVLRAAVAVEES